MNLLLSLAVAFVYVMAWKHINADGHQLMTAIAILLAGGLASCDER